MCESLYHWETDSENGFRKLFIHEFETEFITEKDKFLSWSGEYKCCKSCFRELPKTLYFFRSQNKNYYNKICKECEGNRFKWGLKNQKELASNGKYYCNKCDKVLPLNILYFNKDINSFTGFTSYCKGCNHHSAPYGINQNIDKTVQVADGYSVCHECFFELPKTQNYFFKREKGSDRFESVCKECQGCAYGVKKINAILGDDSLRYCVSCKLVSNSENFNFKDLKRGIKSSYCKSCQNLLSVSRIRSFEESEYSVEDWNFAKEYWTDDEGNTCCAYCDGVFNEGLHMEHIVPFSKGGKYVRNNIIPACPKCNGSKHAKDLEVFYEGSESFTRELYEKVLEYMSETKPIESVV